MSFTVQVEIKVLNSDGEIVDHRGMMPRKGIGAQICKIDVSKHSDINEANKMMNAVYGSVNIIGDLRNIS